MEGISDGASPKSRADGSDVVGGAGPWNAEAMAETPDSAAVAVPTREPTAAKLGLWSAGVALGLLLLAAVLFPVTVLLIPVIIVGLVGVIAWMAVREIRSRRGGLERPPIGDAV